MTKGFPPAIHETTYGPPHTHTYTYIKVTPGMYWKSKHTLRPYDESELVSTRFLHRSLSVCWRCGHHLTVSLTLLQA